MVCRKVFHRQTDVAPDGQENIIEVVGNAAGQRAQGLHFLRLKQLFFHLPAVSDVDADAGHAEGLALRVALHPAAGRNPYHALIGAEEAILRVVLRAFPHGSF